MSLFEKLNNKRSSLHEVKDDELDKIKKPTKKANKEVFDSTGKSAVRDAKKYASGEYPKIGGGTRIVSKSKGTGAETGSKTIKQSEVSKKAKSFTQNINKKRTRRVFPGDKSGAYQAAKSDLETKNLIKKAGGSGDIGFTAPDRKTKVTKRTTRAIKQGTPDPFNINTSKVAKENQKIFKNIGTGPKTFVSSKSVFGPGDTKGQANVKAMDKKSYKITQKKDVKLPKSFTDFSKKLKTLKTDVAKTASATPRTVSKKYKPTTTVKQSEVSKKATDFTKQTNQTRVAKIKNVVKDSKVKNSKGIGNKFRGAENKAARNAEIIKRGGSVTDKVTSNKTRGPYKPQSYRGLGKDAFDLKKYPIKSGSPVSTTGEPKLPQFTKTDSPSFKLSSKGQKVAAKIPKAFRGKTFAKIGKAALKSPVVAAVAGVGLAAAGVYAGYKAYKNITKGKPKLNYRDFKSRATSSDPNKGKIIDRSTGQPARFTSRSDLPKFTKGNSISKSGKYAIK